MVMDKNDFEKIVKSLRKGIDCLKENSTNPKVKNSAGNMKPYLKVIEAQTWF